MSYAIIHTVVSPLERTIKKEDLNMKKKLVAAFLCAAMTATMFARCGDNSADNAQDSNSNSTDDANNAVNDTSAADDGADSAGATDLSDADVAVFFK